jgi:2-C-methyl-D-erythritol 4-phosphate cytidylyltransferase/2-C-methyl-D-erythritol 2,4-cyclodiphosphate synthase
MNEAAPERVVVVLVAAGRGQRAGEGLPKQYRSLAGQAVLRRAVLALRAHPSIAMIQTVIHPDDQDLFAAATDGLDLAPPVLGGATRQASVHAGVKAAMAAGADLILIHDAARPFVEPGLVGRVIAGARQTGAAIPGLPVTDTVKRVDASGIVVETPPRADLRAVQTPQGFRADLIAEAHDRAAAAGLAHFTDDGALMEWAGSPVLIVAGDAMNTKLTTPEDFAVAEQRLTGRLETRSATGFDVHTFGPGDHVMLGGVSIAHDRGVVGHSDADVVLHALTDALLGCLCDGDIGSHFPPSDMRWKGASSDRFLAFAAEKVRAAGGRILHLDATILAEAPRVGPHRDAMKAAIALAAGIAPTRVAIKATTTETMGFVGRREGLAALATATIEIPGDAT